MYGASSDTKTSAKSFADFPQTSRGPIKSDFFEQKKLEISLFSIFIWSWPVNRDDLNGTHNKTNA